MESQRRDLFPQGQQISNDSIDISCLFRRGRILIGVSKTVPELLYPAERCFASRKLKALQENFGLVAKLREQQFIYETVALMGLLYFFIDLVAASVTKCPSGDFMSRMNRLSGGPS